MENANIERENITRVYKLDELVSIMGVSYRTLLKYVNSGRLKGVKIGRTWRVSQANLNAFLNGDTGEATEDGSNKS